MWKIILGLVGADMLWTKASMNDGIHIIFLEQRKYVASVDLKPATVKRMGIKTKKASRIVLDVLLNMGCEKTKRGNKCPE